MRTFRHAPWALLPLFAVGCQRPAKSEPPTLTPPGTSATTHSAGPGADAAALDAPAAAQIACGPESCRAGEQKCCPESSPRCLSAAERDFSPYCLGGESATGALFCDGKGDCGANERCCWMALDSETSGARCTSGDCDLGEVCRSDTDCPSQFRCGGASPSGPGRCVLRQAGVDCASRRCEGGNPVCCYDSEGGAPSCSPEGNCSMSQGRLAVRCRSSKDCGGERCCAFAGTYCQGSCINAQIACDTAAECPKEMLGFALAGCVQAEEPAVEGLRVCHYED